jgi:hypothetical protein
MAEAITDSATLQSLDRDGMIREEKISLAKSEILPDEVSKNRTVSFR